MHTLKKIFRRATRGEILLHFFRRASRGAALPLHFKFVSYAYALAVSPQNGLKRSEILGGHVPTCHTSLARALRALYAISHVHTGTPPFQNPRSATAMTSSDTSMAECHQSTQHLVPLHDIATQLE